MAHSPLSLSLCAVLAVCLCALAPPVSCHAEHQIAGAAAPVDAHSPSSFSCHAATCSFCVLRRMKLHCADFCRQCVGGSSPIRGPSPNPARPRPNPAIGDFDGNDLRGAGGPTLRQVEPREHGLQHGFEQCCSNWNRIPSSCYYLCSYSKMQKQTYLAAYADKTCPLGTASWPILRCAAGGKDHSSCCRAQGVHADCVSFCNGAGAPPAVTGAHAKCLDELSLIRRCFEQNAWNR